MSSPHETQGNVDPISVAELPPEGLDLGKQETKQVSVDPLSGPIYGYDTVPVTDDGMGDEAYSDKFHTTWGRPVMTVEVGHNQETRTGQRLTVVEGAIGGDVGKYFLILGNGDPKTSGLTAEIPELSVDEQPASGGLVFGRNPQAEESHGTIMRYTVNNTISRNHFAVGVRQTDDGKVLEFTNLNPTNETRLSPFVEPEGMEGGVDPDKTQVAKAVGSSAVAGSR